MPPAVAATRLGGRSELLTPALAGVVCGIVGFTSSFAVVLTGLRAVGATAEQAASGLFALCVLMGMGCVLFSWRTRMPITMAWSTPGAALLVSGHVPAGGFGAAIVGFAIAGLLIALCGLVGPLQRLVEAIPHSVANAMLAGVLLLLCVAPFRALAATPAAIAPVIGVWLLLMRFARRWAVAGALVAAVLVMIVTGAFGSVAAADVVPRLTPVAPVWDWAVVPAIAVPLFLVTMTSQNIPGMAVLGSFGYRPAFGPTLLYTGAATAAGAFGGGHGINLAALSAALAAGPEAGADSDRRWIAGVSGGVVYIVLGPLSTLIAAVATAAPAGLMETIAGLALIGTFATAAAAALADPAGRDAAAVTFVVAASGLAVAGVGAAFWALCAGLLYLSTTRPRRTL